MTKKNFSKWLLFGLIPLLLLLPIFNYHLDRWRVLHRDVTHIYTSLQINKNFLKVSYLLDHPHKYDTLLMGSSRNASLDERLVSSKAYNMYYEFGTVGGHLHNLSVLLDHHVTFKNLWIGINDYDIWKKNSDFQKDYSRVSYPNSFGDWIQLYHLYLFKKPDTTDLSIYRGDFPLIPSNRIVRKNLHSHFESLKQKENRIQRDKRKWQKKLTSMAGMALGYQDNTYHIDQTIKDLLTIKQLCEAHHIKLVLFFYPTFYKTYLLYNQHKIEEFKYKLAQKIPFYDFYGLDKTAMDELKWTDSSHFVLSVGNSIIQSIRNHQHLIDATSIDSRIKTVRRQLQNLLQKPIPIPYILPFNGHISLTALAPLFSLTDLSHLPMEQCRISTSHHTLTLTVTGNDPKFILPKIKTNSENVILHLSIHSEQKTTFQIFYRSSDEISYNEHDSYRRSIAKDDTLLNLLIPSSFLSHGLRVDPANNTGTYQINSFTLYAPRKP